MIDYPLMADWWPPSTAVAFIAFQGDVRRLRSRRIDRLWEHGPLSRMLEIEDEHSDLIQHAAEGLEKELKRGTVAARATRQRGYKIAGQVATRGRPSYIKIAPHEWGSLTDRSGSSAGLSTHFFNDPARNLDPEIEIDVLAKDGIPTLWDWEVRRSDIMRLPDDETVAAAHLAAVRNAMTETPFRVAHIIRELESTGVEPPHLKQDRIALISNYYKARYRRGVGDRTIERTMKALSDAGIASPWL